MPFGNKYYLMLNTTAHTSHPSQSAQSSTYYSPHEVPISFEYFLMISFYCIQGRPAIFGQDGQPKTTIFGCLSSAQHDLTTFMFLLLLS